MIIAGRSRPRDVTPMSLVLHGTRLRDNKIARGLQRLCRSPDRRITVKVIAIRNEVNLDHWLQPRAWPGSSETPGESSATAGEYLCNLPRRE